MSLTRTLALTVVGTLLCAGSAAAQQSPVTAAPTLAPAPGTPLGVGPNGATLRCRDGSYPAAGAPDTACDTKGGIAVRFPILRTAPEAALRTEGAGLPRRDVERARRDTLVVPEGFVSHEQRRAATDTLKPPPANATLLCANGTYIVADTTASRCRSHGGLQLRLEAVRRP